MMHRTCHRLLISLLLIPFFHLQLKAQFPNPPGGTYDRVAVVTSGFTDWHNPATWGGQSVPSTGHRVLIPSNAKVAVKNINTSEVKFLRVEGDMRFVRWANTRITVETMVIASTGSLVIGTSSAPVNANLKAEIVFSNSGAAFDFGWDPKEQSRGLISFGTVTVHGAVKTHMAQCDNSIQNGLTSIDLKLPAPTNWRSNDDLAIAGTQFKRNTALSDEVVRFSSASGNILNLQSSTPTQKKHLRVDVNMNLHIANLTRNVIFRSESSTPLKARGHIMFAPGSTTNVRYATFLNLGRTDKTRPLNERVITAYGTGTGQFTNVPGDSTNRRGRYACHFHINGPGPSLTAPASTVIGCVVRGTPGWGFVNHSSHVLFDKNVCYDFNGAAFVTEAGDELGSFTNNIAMHGIGQDRNGNGIPEKYFIDRHVFANAERPQPLADFAFGGEGFWFQGTAVRATNNVATNCNGPGMIWFGTGSPEVYSGKYVGFPASWINTVYGNTSGLVYRNNSQAYPGGNGGTKVISDLPILQMNGFDAYGCLVGFKLRFNNHGAVAWYNEGPYDFHLAFQGGNNLLRQKVENLRLWNNEQGFRARYNDKTDWKNIKSINRLRYNDVNKPYPGAELRHSISNHTIQNLNMSGYGVATYTLPTQPAGPIDVSYIAPTVKTNYANADYGNLNGNCPRVILGQINSITASQAKVNWPASSNNSYLVRYQRTTDIKWSYRRLGGSATSVTLTGLSGSTQYRVQVLGGCASSINFWSPEKTFNTSGGGGKIRGSAKAAGPGMLGEISLYPNPVADQRLRLQAPANAQIEAVSIYDLQGRMLLQVEVDEALQEGIYLDGLLTKGMYLLQVKTPAGLKILRFVKQ